MHDVDAVARLAQLGEFGADDDRGAASRTTSVTSAMISRFATTSMPAVGCSSSRMRAPAMIQRARITFCWLPPDSVCSNASADWHLMPNRAIASSAIRRSARCASQPPR